MKNLKFKKFLLFVSGLLAIAGFAMMFLAILVRDNSISLGSVTLDVEDSVFNLKEIFFDIKNKSDIVTSHGVILPFIGYVVSLLVGALLIFSAFQKKPSSALTMLFVILLVACAVIVILTKTLYLNANFENGTVIKTLDLAKESFSLGLGSILGFVLMVLAALTAGFSAFVKTPKGKKR